MLKRGIVTLAGGDKYNINAFLSIKNLRYYNKDIPVFWCYLSEVEMSDKWRSYILDNLENVTLHNLNTGVNIGTKDLGGWQAKPYSILASPFDEVLFLDADNFVLKDPAPLFDHKIFKEIGAIIWPDITAWNDEQVKVINEWFDVDLDTQKQYSNVDKYRQAESGQLLFNLKNPDVVRALEKVCYYNDNSDHYYKVVYGDKDTFLLGFYNQKVPVYLVGNIPSFSSRNLAHVDLDNNPMFLHLTGGKWNVQKYNKLPFENFDYLEKEYIKLNNYFGWWNLQKMSYDQISEFSQNRTKFGITDFKDKIIIDIGANIGEFSLKCLENGAKKVYSIEWRYDIYHQLKENVPNVIAQQFNDNTALNRLFRKIKDDQIDYLKIDKIDKPCDLILNTKNEIILKIKEIEIYNPNDISDLFLRKLEDLSFSLTIIKNVAIIKNNN